MCLVKVTKGVCQDRKKPGCGYRKTLITELSSANHLFFFPQVSSLGWIIGLSTHSKIILIYKLDPTHSASAASFAATVPGHWLLKVLYYPPKSHFTYFKKRPHSSLSVKLKQTCLKYPALRGLAFISTPNHMPRHACVSEQRALFISHRLYDLWILMLFLLSEIPRPLCSHCPISSRFCE